MTKFGKIWGDTSPLLLTPTVEVHKIHARAGYACSWHSHEHKWNAFYVVKGQIRVEARKKDYALVDATELEEGDMTTVPPNEEHRFTSDDGAVVLEIYYPQHLGAPDIVRRGVGGPTS